VDLTHHIVVTANVPLAMTRLNITKVYGQNWSEKQNFTQKKCQLQSLHFCLELKTVWEIWRCYKSYKQKTSIAKWQTKRTN